MLMGKKMKLQLETQIKKKPVFLKNRSEGTRRKEGLLAKEVTDPIWIGRIIEKS